MGRTGPVLVINAGSSSLKYQVVDAGSGETAATGIVERIGTDGRIRHTADGRTHRAEVACPTHSEAFDAARAALREYGPDLGETPPVAVGHRVVHGGDRFSAPVLIDDAVLEAVRGLIPLAPLHNPPNLEGIEHARLAYPDVPHVAVFDTAFHQSLPPRAHTYAVPREWRERHHVRRYGFHGTSYAYVAPRAAQLLGLDEAQTNLVVLHLGNGASACAVEGGTSIDTSMGMTPVEGLVMGTRSGDVDPSLAAYLTRVAGLDPAAYDDALNHASGLSGLSGHSDCRELEDRMAAGDLDAALAFDVMTYRLRKYVGAYAVALGRVDAIVFTGGIGEHSPQVRAAVLGGLGVLGVELDEEANEREEEPERCITAPGSRIAGLVVPTNEELEIARACLSVIGGEGSV